MFYLYLLNGKFEVVDGMTTGLFVFASESWERLYSKSIELNKALNL